MRGKQGLRLQRSECEELGGNALNDSIVSSMLSNCATAGADVSEEGMFA